MTKIEEIAERRGVFMLEHDSIVLVVAGDTHWFSDEADVEYADREATTATDEDPGEVFFEECMSIYKDNLRSTYATRVAALLDTLLEEHADVYGQLGGEHDEIVRRAV